MSHNIDYIINSIIKKYINETDEHIKIKPDEQWLRKWFHILNKDYFNEYLDEGVKLSSFIDGRGSNGRRLGSFRITASNIRIMLTTNRMFAMTYSGTEFINRDNFVKLCKPLIEINGNYSATEEAWLGVLIHEMCHYYTYINGYAPKQSHGDSFKSIAKFVSDKSNGRFHIQRLASEEDMKNFEIDSAINAKNIAREQNKISKIFAVIIVENNGTIRLVTTSSLELLNSILSIHEKRKDAKFVGYCDNKELISYLFNLGYKKNFRTYRYWTINTNNEELVKKILSYKWNSLISPSPSLSQVIE